MLIEGTAQTVSQDELCLIDPNTSSIFPLRYISMNPCITKPNLVSTAGQWSLDDLEALQLLDQMQRDSF